jgi:hypothetical protein
VTADRFLCQLGCADHQAPIALIDEQHLRQVRERSRRYADTLLPNGQSTPCLPAAAHQVASAELAPRPRSPEHTLFTQLRVAVACTRAMKPIRCCRHAAALASETRYYTSEAERGRLELRPVAGVGRPHVVEVCNCVRLHKDAGVLHAEAVHARSVRTTAAAAVIAPLTHQPLKLLANALAARAQAKKLGVAHASQQLEALGGGEYCAANVWLARARPAPARSRPTRVDVVSKHVTKVVGRVALLDEVKAVRRPANVGRGRAADRLDGRVS